MHGDAYEYARNLIEHHQQILSTHLYLYYSKLKRGNNQTNTENKEGAGYIGNKEMHP
jgi:hypothetical protein